jgi:hypothetical protein
MGTMTKHLFLLLPIVTALAAQSPAIDDIVGTWSGSSICVNREAAPACADEQVVYEIAATPGRAMTVTVKADKVVDGKRVPMGDLDFTRDTREDPWTTTIDTPRVHAIWQLTVKNGALTGTMMLLPSKVLVRKMDLRKSAS